MLARETCLHPTSPEAPRLPLIGHEIGHILEAAKPREPRQVHTEVLRQQCHIQGRSKMGTSCGEKEVMKSSAGLGIQN
jgi:hypothetical protein